MYKFQREKSSNVQLQSRENEGSQGTVNPSSYPWNDILICPISPYENCLGVTITDINLSNMYTLFRFPQTTISNAKSLEEQELGNRLEKAQLDENIQNLRKLLPSKVRLPVTITDEEIEKDIYLEVKPARGKIMKGIIEKGKRISLENDLSFNKRDVEKDITLPFSFRRKTIVEGRFVSK